VCLRERLDRCQSLGYFDALSMSPIVTYDLSHAEPAFAEFEKRASTCDLDILKWMFSDAGFRNVARGTIPPGGDCTPRMDAGLVGIDYLGACREPETNSCVYTTPVGDVWKCSPRSDVGGPCYTDYNCTDGLGCNYDFGAARTCEQRRPDGALCMIFLQCQSMYCDAGSCKPATPEKVYCWM